MTFMVGERGREREKYQPLDLRPQILLAAAEMGLSNRLPKRTISFMEYAIAKTKE